MLFKACSHTAHYRRNPLLYLLCTISIYLDQENCSPSTFGLFANGAAKILNIKASCFLRRFFRLREESLFLHFCSVSLKEICKNLEILQQMVQLLSTTVALFTNESRNHVDFEL